MSIDDELVTSRFGVSRAETKTLRFTNSLYGINSTQPLARIQWCNFTGRCVILKCKHISTNDIRLGAPALFWKYNNCQIMHVQGPMYLCNPTWRQSTITHPCACNVLTVACIIGSITETACWTQNLLMRWSTHWPLGHGGWWILYKSIAVSPIY